MQSRLAKWNYRPLEIGPVMLWIILPQFVMGLDFPPTHEAAGWKAAPGAGVYNGCIGLLIGCAADEHMVRRQLLVASTGDGCRPWPLLHLCCTDRWNRPAGTGV